MAGVGSSGAWSCEQDIGSTFVDTPALCGGSRKNPTCLWPAPHNLVMTEMIWAPSWKWASVQGFATPLVSPAGIFNQRRIFSIAATTGAATTASGVAAVVAELPLASTPSAAGKTVHLTAMARLRTGSSVYLMIDRGDKAWLKSTGGGAAARASSVGGGNSSSTEWQIRSFQARLGWSGTARFAIVVAGGPSPKAEVGWVRVAQIGTPE